MQNAKKFRLKEKSMASAAVKPVPDYPRPDESEEILDWDYALQTVPARPSGTIEVSLTKIMRRPFVSGGE